MSSRRSVRQLLVAVVLGVLVGGGLMAVTPAGAEVSQAAATSWKKIWKKQFKPLAAKTFYSKKQSDAKYQPKGWYETAGSGYTKAESDARLGDYYKKAESDGRYAPAPAVLRGSWSMMDGGVNGAYVSTDIDFGHTFGAPLAVHYIPSGAPVPSGCAGTPAAPSAAAGNLCVFEFGRSGISQPEIRNAVNIGGTTSPFGANLFASTTSASVGNYAYGSWAARGASLAPAGGGQSPVEGPAGSTDPGE